MALAFPCATCGNEIIVQYLKLGEIANCPNCGAKTPVPASASVVACKELPSAAKVSTTVPGSQEEISRCPRCNTALVINGVRCANCSYTMESIRLYNPKYFVVLASLLSGFVPIYLTASNWGRIGKDDIKRRWLILGFIGFLLLFSILIIADIGKPTVKLVGYLLNPTLGLLVRNSQKRLYDTSLRLGAQPASLVKGTLVGFGLVLCALSLPVIGLMGFSEYQVNKAANLMENEKYAEAAKVFSLLHKLDREDAATLYNVALCYTLSEQWNLAEKTWKEYTARHPKDAKGFALSGFVQQRQGREKEAQELYETAKSIDSNILDEMLSK